MKNSIFLILIAAFAPMILSAGCDQTASNGARSNTTANHNGMTHSNAMNHNGMNHNSMAMSHDAMNHSEMKTDANAASQPFDLQFMDTMTHHHEGAIQMSEMVLNKSNNAELKKFAVKIVEDQKKEIAQMKDWRDKWFAEKPPAKNMEMSSVKMMTGDSMKKMESASGKEFDLQFLDMMIPHHSDAVTMSQEALQKGEHAEIKTLANRIIKAQEAEIRQMTDWKAQWSK
jgi:uncharacterized protein (DUF305 family)